MLTLRFRDLLVIGGSLGLLTVLLTLIANL